MKKRIVLIPLMILMLRSAFGQDFHLSLYDAGPLFLNPALTGVIDTKLRVHAQYRNQWSSVAFKPYNTYLLSADMPHDEKFGYGVQVMNMRAGVGGYNVFQFLGSGSYNIPIDKTKTHDLSFGMQLGFTQKSIRQERYSFESQYTTVDGGSFDKSLDDGENFDRRSKIFAQLNAGLLYYYAKQQSRVNPFLGVSAFNLTKPNESFFDQNNKLPMRFCIHTGVRVNITEDIFVLPKILVMFQGKAREQTYAVDGGYYLKEGDIFILGGFIYRAKDAAIISVGAKKMDYTLKFGYDINTSSLKTASRRKGAWEISLTYLFGREKLEKVKHCPRI